MSHIAFVNGIYTAILTPFDQSGNLMLEAMPATMASSSMMAFALSI